MTDHPIIPPRELVQEWIAEIWHEGTPVQVAHSDLHIATRAAQWGADTELTECCKCIYDQGWFADPSLRIAQLRAARRPKPSSLKEQALETLRSMQIEPCWIDGINTNAELMSKYDTIRRAINQLPDD